MNTKKIKFVALFFIAICFGVALSGCSSDDESEVIDSNSLVGEWIRYSNNDQELTEFIFKSNGTCNYSYSYMPDNDWEEGEYQFGYGQYKTDGNKLTLTLQFGDEVEIWEYTIISVDANMLVLKDADGKTLMFESLYE